MPILEDLSSKRTHLTSSVNAPGPSVQSMLWVMKQSFSHIILRELFIHSCSVACSNEFGLAHTYTSHEAKRRGRGDSIHSQELSIQAILQELSTHWNPMKRGLFIHF